MARRRVHDLIFFIVMLVILNAITISLFIEKGSKKVIDDYKKELKTEVTLSSISEDHQSEVSIKDAQKLIHSKYIKTYNYEKILNASSVTIKPVDTRLCFPRIRLSQSEDSPFLIAGYSSMTLVQDFNQKEYKLIEGRLLNKDDENTYNTVVSQSLAKENNLKIGDPVQFRILDHETTFNIVGIYKNKVGVMSHLKPYNTLFISLKTAMNLNNTPESLSSVTYYLNNEKDAEKFIKQSERKSIDWNKLQLKSNDAQYDACVSIFESINSKTHKIYWITFIAGSLIILLIYYLGLSKYKNKRIYKTGCIILLALLLTFVTSPYISKYTVNTYLSVNNMNMAEKASKKIKTIYTPQIISKTVSIAAIIYLETAILHYIYKKKVN